MEPVLDDFYWTCGTTHANQESKALTHLRHQGFEAFFPFFTFRTKHRHISIKPVFPGYVFIRLTEDRNWSPINNTHGMQRLLTLADSQGALPCRIPPTFIQEFHRFCVSSNKLRGEIPKGTRVRILRGIFREQEALVEWHENDRIGLLLAVFNRRIELEFALEDVEDVAA